MKRGSFSSESSQQQLRQTSHLKQKKMGFPIVESIDLAGVAPLGPAHLTIVPVSNSTVDLNEFRFQNEKTFSHSDIEEARLTSL